MDEEELAHQQALVGDRAADIVDGRNFGLGDRVRGLQGLCSHPLTD